MDSLLSLPQASLMDLENEPFSTHDTGVRSEINHINLPRALFQFRVVEHDGDIHISCKVSGRDYGLLTGSSREYQSRQTLWKTSTQISLIDVYDNYGLEAARSHVQRLLDSDIMRYEPLWVAIYLVGSLAVINPITALDLCKSLRVQSSTASEVIDSACLALLSGLASEGAPSNCSLVPVTVELPIELLVQIISSVRVSKELARHVTRLRLSRELLPDEMEHRAVFPFTVKLNSVDRRGRSLYRITGDSTIWILQTRDDEFRLHSYPASMVWGIEESAIVLYSPRDTALARGVPIRAVIETVIDTENIESICAWTVQLLCEIGSTVDSTPMNKQELIDYCISLVSLRELSTEMGR